MTVFVYLKQNGRSQCPLQKSIKYIVNIVLFLTRPCYFTVLIEGHRFAERAPETLI